MCDETDVPGLNSSLRPASPRMPMVPCGQTGLMVSQIAFGAGPVSGLMTGDDAALQLAVVQAAVASGINWIDTAAGYGDGRSESNIGRALAQLDPEVSGAVHIATKFRFDTKSSIPLRQQLRESIGCSLTRLRRSSVTLLQVHNGLTDKSGDEPASVSSELCLQPGGLADELHRLQSEGLARFIGLTGTGSSSAMRRVVRSGEFDTIQLPYNLLNPSAGQLMDCEFEDRNYGNILDDCLQLNLGVFAIRVFAAGALLGQQPSAHTMTTPYFPLSQYVNDAQAVTSARGSCSTEDFAGRAIQFALDHPAVHSAIIGFGSEDHIATAVKAVRGRSRSQLSRNPEPEA